MERPGIYIMWLAVLSVVCSSLAGCAYRLTDEDWEKNGKVRVLLNWQTRSGDIPLRMNYYFYKEGVAVPIVRSGEPNGYEGTLPMGRYQLAVCNPDGSNIELDMYKGYAQARAVARPVSSLKASVASVSQPRHLYGGGLDELIVGGSSDNTSELFTKNLVRQVSLNIRITGLEDIERIRGALTGVSPEIHIPSGTALFERSASVSFEPEQTTSNLYTTSFTVFGLSSGEEEKDITSELSLTVTMKNGEGFTSRTDVSDEVNEAFNQSISANIVLDMEVSPTEVDGITIRYIGWHEGSGAAGNK